MYKFSKINFNYRLFYKATIIVGNVFTTKVLNVNQYIVLLLRHKQRKRERERKGGRGH